MLLAMTASMRLGLGAAAAAGLGFSSLVFAGSLLVMDATPRFASIAYHAAGIVIGATLVRALRADRARRIDRTLRTALRLSVLPYLVLLFVLNDLASAAWRSPAAAFADLNVAGVLPFVGHYLVSKAQAAVSVVSRIVMYAPVGLIVWSFAGRRIGLAALAAGALAALVELGRFLKPGLTPDPSNVIIAAAAAAAAAAWFPRTLEWLREERWGKGALRAAMAAAPMPEPPLEERKAGSLPWRICVAAVAGVLALALVLRHPVAPLPLGVAGLAYAAALWRWPRCWLIVVPVALIAVDLGPWTGWFYVAESDLFVLVTIATLAMRAPFGREDLRFDRWTLVVLALSIASWAISIVVGLRAAPADLGGNPYLAPANALRIGKGFAIALALLPFLAHARRTTRDAGALLAVGVACALATVAGCVVVERLLFPGLLDFDSVYRVAGPFSGMHLGGGLIGAFIALALPFVVTTVATKRPLMAALLLPFAAYALVVTFARAAYAAALAGCVVALAVQLLGMPRSRTGRMPALVSALLVLALVAAAALALGSRFMGARMATIAGDFTVREANWTGGLAERRAGIATALFGSGLGTFARLNRTSSEPAHRAVDFAVRQDDGGAYLVLQSGSPLYFGQKVPAVRGEDYRLELELRSPEGAGHLVAIMCEKYLLYSGNCVAAEFTAEPGWTPVRAALAMPRPATTGFEQHRPVELALRADSTAAIEVRHIRLLDQSGRDIVANGNFEHGTERWFFTDDDHLIWRIKDQYLMLLFEQGWLGLAAFLALVGLALVRALRTGIAAEILAPAIVGSLAAFLVSGLFDSLLEAPRLATLFYLVCFAGLLLGLPREGHRAPELGA
jgi:hypothetical protein